MKKYCYIGIIHDILIPVLKKRTLAKRNTSKKIDSVLIECYINKVASDSNVN